MSEPAIRRYAAPKNWTRTLGGVVEVDRILASLWADEGLTPSTMAMSHGDAKRFFRALLGYELTNKPYCDVTGHRTFGSYLDKFACGMCGKPAMVQVIEMTTLPDGTFLMAIPQ